MIEPFDFAWLACSQYSACERHQKTAPKSSILKSSARNWNRIPVPLNAVSSVIQLRHTHRLHPVQHLTWRTHSRVYEIIYSYWNSILCYICMLYVYISILCIYVRWRGQPWTAQKSIGDRYAETALFRPQMTREDEALWKGSDLTNNPKCE